MESKYIYLLSSNGDRDSIDLTRGVSKLENLKILIKEYVTYFFDGSLIENSIFIDEKEETVTFKYLGEGTFLEKKIFYFHKIEIV